MTTSYSSLTLADFCQELRSRRRETADTAPMDDDTWKWIVEHDAVVGAVKDVAIRRPWADPSLSVKELTDSVLTQLWLRRYHTKPLSGCCVALMYESICSAFYHLPEAKHRRRLRRLAEGGKMEVATASIVQIQQAKTRGLSRYDELLLEAAFLRAIDQLPKRESLMVRRCYFDDTSQAEIASAFNLSESRVSEIFAVAIKSVMKYLAEHDWLDEKDE